MLSRKKYLITILFFTFVYLAVDHFLLSQYLPRMFVNNAEREESTCPLTVRKNIGLFNKEKSKSDVKDKFPNTILLVSSNYAYYNMLQNWEYLADKQNLQWTVLAMDQKIYEELGPERAVLTDSAYSTPGASSFFTEGFKTLTCNKLRMVLDIYEKCDVNIVFSDVDNIFFKNPFEHDLGRMIQSNRYDYIYQPNRLGETEPHQDHCMKEGKFDKENNTGFYYARRKSEIFSRIMEQTVKRCNDPDNKSDDQTLFWLSYWDEKEELGENANFHHCGSKEGNIDISDLLDEAKSGLSFDICCMDPYYYPVGRGGKPLNDDPVTYHANFVRGYENKVDLLKNARDDKHGWDVTRFKDGVGGVLDPSSD